MVDADGTSRDEKKQKSTIYSAGGWDGWEKQIYDLAEAGRQHLKTYIKAKEQEQKIK